MTSKAPTPFSLELQNKIDRLKLRRQPLQIGKVDFASPLIMAPLASITAPPWRLLMEDLGAGGTVSELISCHGINYQNDKTLKMLKVDPREKHVGIQLFGEEAESLADAAKIAEQFGAKFIDLNMGCPVRKVVGKGAGAALMQEPAKLPELFRSIKKVISIPFTIKIRTGWDENQLNAKEIIHIAHEEGIEFVALHGRTRAQQYGGKANWEMIEELAQHSPLPIIGNGDLHTPHTTAERLKRTHCQGLMLGRGPLRNPFIFIEALAQDEDHDIFFTAQDHWEVVKRLYEYSVEHFDREKTLAIQMKKHIVWLAGGYTGASQFRAKIFTNHSIPEFMKMAEDYFRGLENRRKQISEEAFLVAGEG